MATRAYLDNLPLDESSVPVTWPLYRGTEARKCVIYGNGERWAEYKAFVNGLKGKPTKLNLRGVKQPGSHGGNLDVSIPEVYVTRCTKINDLLVELECYDARILLMEAVGDMDFNMSCGDGYLPGTGKSQTVAHTYKSAIQAYCERVSAIKTRLGSDPYSGIPERKLEYNVHLSALVSPDPLGYLCDRAGCDLVIGLDGKWYFASREDASEQWFNGLADYNWIVKPGFLTLDSLTLRRPQNIISYYWEHHTLRLEGVDDQSTASTYGPASNKVWLEQVYFDDENGGYVSLDDLLTNHSLSGLTDATIARSFFAESAQGSGIDPLDTFQKKLVWGIIKRDWRRLWKIVFPEGTRGGFDQWRFGQIQDDGSVEGVSVEVPWVEFRRVIQSDAQGSLEGRPWTFNHEAATADETKSPFSAVWDRGPESGVIRIVVDDGPARLRDERPPFPGAITVTREGRTDDALRIIAKNKIDNEDGQTPAVPGKAIDHLRIFAREDITKARLEPSFRMAIYLTGRRFMPNDKSRWHMESAKGFSDGDIDTVELPPGDEVQVYRTYVGGDHSTADWIESDGLGLTLNNLEVHDDGERRAERWKLEHALAVTGEGRADTLNLGTRFRVVNGPIQEVTLNVEGIETYCMMRVGNLADDKARDMTAMKRLAARKFEVQGVRR